ncbi:hypothetical protein D3C72_521700 [compost metagenome]
MRMHVVLWAPGERARPGRRDVDPTEQSPRADRETPATQSGPVPKEPSSDTSEGGPRTSGPGPNNLTRGLP